MHSEVCMKIDYFCKCMVNIKYDIGHACMYSTVEGTVCLGVSDEILHKRETTS